MDPYAEAIKTIAEQQVKSDHSLLDLIQSLIDKVRELQSCVVILQQQIDDLRNDGTDRIQ